MLKQSAAIAALLISFGPSFGQTTQLTTGLWTREKAINYALKENVDLRAARLSIEIAEARLQHTGIRSNPELEIDYASDLLFNNEGEYNLGIGIAQRFPLANRLRKAKEVTRVDIAKAKMEVKQLERSIVNAISEIALEISIVDSQLTLFEERLKKTDEIEKFITSRVRNGELSILEANQVTLEKRGLELEMRQLQDERERLARSLSPYLGLSAGTPVEFAQSGTIDPNQNLPGLDHSIFERHPAFQMAVLEAHSAEAEIALAESEDWESITARLFWENERSLDEPAGLGTDRFLGVGISIPLPLKKKGNLLAREHHIARDQSRLKAAAIKLQVESDIENARNEALNLRSQLVDYRQNVVQLALTQLDETQRAYQNGQLSLVSLLRAQEQLLRLERGYLDRLEAFARARLRLQLARIDLPEKMLNSTQP